MRWEDDGLIYFDNMHEAQAERLKEWTGSNPAFGIDFYCNELFGEAGEAANALKKLEREEGGVPGSRTTIKGLQDELADVLICARNLVIKAGCGTIDHLQLSYDKSSTGFKTRSQWSLQLGRQVGEICTIVLLFDLILDRAMLRDRLTMLANMVRDMCSRMCMVDLDLVAADKFNATSANVGLPHRVALKMEGLTLEETFK